MTDEEAVQRAASAIEALEDHMAAGNPPGYYSAPSAAEIIREHVGEDQSAQFASRYYRLLRRAARVAGLEGRQSRMGPTGDSGYDPHDFGRVREGAWSEQPTATGVTT